MKTKFFVFATIILTLISCNKNEDEVVTNPILGTWELKEILADPGDGSGKFNPVNSNKKLTFNKDGSLTSNGSICNMSVESNVSSNGTYNETNATIYSSNCENFTIKYEVTGNTLILNYQCIESCKAKYYKVK
jgi:hypothetical protein